MIYFLYRIATQIVTPLIPTLLDRRMARGKEDAQRLQERFGLATVMRPQRELIWIHSASVGEANAVLPLIERLLNANPALSILLTTVTVTSAKLMGTRLPARAIHQFAPVDTLDAVEKFLEHWRPDIALWVDSEFWPNLIMQTKKRGIVMGIINARMSGESFNAWKFFPFFIKKLLSSFTLCFAQSAQDAERLSRLGVTTDIHIGNLKYDAPPLPCDESNLTHLRNEINNRHIWLAASTHEGEEQIIADVHRVLKSEFADLLTIIVPRHAIRGDEIVKELPDFNIAQRSKNETIEANTDIYLADTMGELGLFYRLAPIAFIGGSLVTHGGQNPLEAARLDCAVIIGPYVSNFLSIVEEMQASGAIKSVATAEELTVVLKELIADESIGKKMVSNAKRYIDSKCGIINDIIAAIKDTGKLSI